MELEALLLVTLIIAHDFAHFVAFKRPHLRRPLALVESVDGRQHHFQGEEHFVRVSICRAAQRHRHLPTRKQVHLVRHHGHELDLAHRVVAVEILAVLLLSARERGGTPGRGRMQVTKRELPHLYGERERKGLGWTKERRG